MKNTPISPSERYGEDLFDFIAKLQQRLTELVLLSVLLQPHSQPATHSELFIYQPTCIQLESQLNERLTPAVWLS